MATHNITTTTQFTLLSKWAFLPKTTLMATDNPWPLLLATSVLTLVVNVHFGYAEWVLSEVISKDNRNKRLPLPAIISIFPHCSIWSGGVRSCDTASVHCIVCGPPKVKSSFITIYLTPSTQRHFHCQAGTLSLWEIPFWLILTPTLRPFTVVNVATSTAFIKFGVSLPRSCASSEEHPHD